MSQAVVELHDFKSTYEQLKSAIEGLTEKQLQWKPGERMECISGTGPSGSIKTYQGGYSL